MTFPQVIPSVGDEDMDGNPIALFDSSDAEIMFRQAIIYYDTLTVVGQTLTILTEVRRLNDDNFVQLDPLVTVNGGMAHKCHVIPSIACKGLKVTVQQTGGAFANIKWEVSKV